MKILNLYAGIGGNRRLWKGHSISAVELDEDIATVYHNLYPDDTLVIGDAHEYLLNHYNEFDFIWASPPCQTHSSFRQNLCVRYRGTKPVYPDMKLYQEVIFLQNNFKGDWVIENVKPYYEPLIKPKFELQRHYFWSNVYVLNKQFNTSKLRVAQIPDLQIVHNVNLSKYKITNKRQVLRNCVLSEVGLYILQSITETVQETER